MCSLIGPGPYDPVNFTHSTNSTNKYFPLIPGTTFFYKTVNPAGPSKSLETDKFTETDKTKVIVGVSCIIVHNRAFSDGELIETLLRQRVVFRRSNEPA